MVVTLNTNTSLSVSHVLAMMFVHSVLDRGHTDLNVLDTNSVDQLNREISDADHSSNPVTVGELANIRLTLRLVPCNMSHIRLEWEERQNVLRSM